MANAALAEKLEQVGNIKGTGILPGIDQRLVIWAEHICKVYVDGGGGSRNLIATLMATKGVMARCTNPDALELPDYVDETHTAVQGSTEGAKEVIRYHYLVTDLTKEQKLERMKISSATYYRRLAQSHREVLFQLKNGKPVKGGGSREVLMGVRR